MEENHYYPFGLTLSTTAMGITEQPLKYQTIELEKNFGLETYETFYRGLDPQLGRFNNIDPKAEQFYALSPYVSMGNNPVSYVDPEGDLFFLAPFIIPAIQATLVTLSAYYVYETVKQSYSGSNNYGAPWSAMGTSTTYGSYDPSHFGGFSQTQESNSPFLLNASDKKEAEVGSEENPHETSRAARRDAMREGGVPTSQPLIKDKDTKSEDEVFLTRDGEYTVQNAKNDESHQGKPHWEAGKTVKDKWQPDGLNRGGSGRSQTNKPRMQAPKGKSYYKPKSAKTALPPAEFKWNKT